MSDRNFFDTKIFVYSVDSGAPRSKATSATALIRAGIANRNAVVSYQVIQEFVNVALRKFEVPMIPSDLGEYIDHSFRRMAVVHSSLELFHAALTIQSRYRLSWYDSIIVGAAIESGCSTLYSEDMQHGAKFGAMQVQNPFR